MAALDLVANHPAERHGGLPLQLKGHAAGHARHVVLQSKFRTYGLVRFVIFFKFFHFALKKQNLK